MNAPKSQSLIFPPNSKAGHHQKVEVDDTEKLNNSFEEFFGEEEE